jgi:hypothetical protein
MQYTRRDWRNRNKIKTPQGVQWLTVPVIVKGKYHQKIYETEINGSNWPSEHWKALKYNYERAQCYKEISGILEEVYTKQFFSHLSPLNKALIEFVCTYLDIKTKITSSSDYVLSEGKTERLADLCRQAGGTEYFSGPAAKEYLDEDVFSNMGIALRWFDYSGYPEYPQLWGEFTHGVSILDLLFNCGKESPRYMRYVQ